MDHRSRQLLYRFGYNVGMAFQISDDLLDLLGTEKQIGKPPGSDIRQGNITLPVFLLFKRLQSKKSCLTEINKIRESNGAGDTRKALNLIRKSAGIPRSGGDGHRYINKAIQALSGLPNIPAKKNLTDIAHFVAKRNYNESKQEERRMERTFLMVKPDGVQRGLIGEIVSRFERKGLKLVAQNLCSITRNWPNSTMRSIRAKPSIRRWSTLLRQDPYSLWFGKAIM